MLLAALVKSGREIDGDSERGTSAEYRRSPMKVSQISRAISMVVRKEGWKKDGQKGGRKTGVNGEDPGEGAGGDTRIQSVGIKEEEREGEEEEGQGGGERRG